MLHETDVAKSQDMKGTLPDSTTLPLPDSATAPSTSATAPSIAPVSRAGAQAEPRLTFMSGDVYGNVKVSPFAEPQDLALLNDKRTFQRLRLNNMRNHDQDNAGKLDALALAFSYADCKDQYWQDERHSLMYGTPLWFQATPAQRLVLNHLYWVAYYVQIISAEIATIYLNQAAGAGLYTVENFRIVCDALDLESAQERAHISAFKTIAEQVEYELFGERMFTYRMRPYYVETMVFQNSNRVKEFYRRLQIQAYTMLSTGNAFLGCQYFTIRGLRTLNGKMVQHQLSQFYVRGLAAQNQAQSEATKDASSSGVPDPLLRPLPIPAEVSHLHFCDESYHFNSSMIISQEVVRSISPPTAFEKWVSNKLVAGCQKDHFHFSTAINGIFWYDPALYSTLFKLLRSPVFGMNATEALGMMDSCFAQENDGMHASQKTHHKARESYKAYVANMSFIDPQVKEMNIMGSNNLARQLAFNRKALRDFASHTVR